MAAAGSASPITTNATCNPMTRSGAHNQQVAASAMNASGNVTVPQLRRSMACMLGSHRRGTATRFTREGALDQSAQE